jgi:hypothetical protein
MKRELKKPKNFTFNAETIISKALEDNTRWQRCSWNTKSGSQKNVGMVVVQSSAQKV